MNGVITKRMWAKAVLLACGGASLAGAGCYEYRDCVDPCYPMRYEYMARKRMAAIQRFMQAQTAGKGLDFQVATIDPSEIGLPAIPVGSAITQLYTTRFKGGLPTQGGNVSGGR